MKKSTPSESIRGFTLIEALIALAIMGIVASLVFPVVAASKARAQDSHCISNLSSLGKAIALYAADHDDYPPPGGAGEGSPAPDVKPKLFPYGVKLPLWRCPRDRWHTDIKGGKFLFVRSPNFERYGSSYVYDGRSLKLGMSLTSGIKPAETLLMADVWAYHSDIGEPDGIFNVLYRDLHVRGTRWSMRDQIRWPDFQ